MYSVLASWSKKMVSDILCDKMDRKTKKEQKKKKKWGMFRSSSPDVVVSTAAPADCPKSSSSSSRKRKCPHLRRAFRRMLSRILSCVSSSELDESIEIRTSSTDTHTDASSSPAVSGSSDPELDLLPAIQEKEAIRAVPTSSGNSDGSSSSAESKPSDLESSAGCSSSSAVGTFSSDESERIDLLAELQGTVVPEDAAGDQTVSDVDLDCVLDVLASVTAQANGLSQTEILQLIQCAPQQEEVEVEQQRDTEEEDDDVELADYVLTASPAKIKHLGFPNLGNTCYMNSVLQCLLTASPFRDDVLSQREQWNEGSSMLRALTDLQLTRLTGNDVQLKVMILSAVKRGIEIRHPDFRGDHQQDAHEFLMVFLSHLKEEGEFLKVKWPKYTCPVANMGFKLNRLRTCDSCGFQRSFSEDCNYLSLVISPQRTVIDSLQQYFKTSSFECSCNECAGTTTSEALQLITFPRLLVLLVMRFDVGSSMCKLKDQLEVPEEFSLSSSTESREMTVIDRKRPYQQQKRRKKNRVAPAVPQMEASDCGGQYRLAGAVSHLGSSLYCGHYISHIRDLNGSDWLECSDASINRTSWSKASSKFGRNGYMLFYVKR